MSGPPLVTRTNLSNRNFIALKRCKIPGSRSKNIGEPARLCPERRSAPTVSSSMVAQFRVSARQKKRSGEQSKRRTAALSGRRNRRSVALPYCDRSTRCCSTLALLFDSCFFSLVRQDVSRTTPVEHWLVENTQNDLCRTSHATIPELL